MSKKRMFSPDIVGSDAFMEMSATAQLLYFHLGMRADDDGFVNPQVTMRMMGANVDDLRMLLVKRFLLDFKNGVQVVKHWRINNFIRKDRYQPTTHRDEYDKLYVKENMAYTLDSSKGVHILEVDWKSNEEMRLTSGQPTVNLGKVRLGKVRLDTTLTTFVLFWNSFPRKVAKATAERAWKKLNPSPDLVEKILRDVVTRSSSEAWSKENRRFCPHASTYLNQKRWEDEIEEDEGIKFINLDSKK